MSDDATDATDNADATDSAFGDFRRDIARRVRPLPIQEIARRARRRRLRQWTSGVAAAVVVAAIGLGVWLGSPASNRSRVVPIGPLPSTSSSPTSATSAPPSQTSAPPSQTSAPPSQPNVTSVALSEAYWFDDLTTDAGQLQLTGTPPSPTESTPCIIATVDPAPFAVGPVTSGSCSDPTSFGETVSVVNSYISMTDNATIAIAHRVAGKATTGPVIMTYSHSSDGNPVVALGGGSLWIYDVGTTNGPEAVEVSATSGQVEDTVAMPKLYRPIAAADSDGLWLGNSIQGSPAAATIFHVAPGSHTVSEVLPGSTEVVDWLVADDGHLWAGTRPAGGVNETLRRFDGSAAKLALTVSEPNFVTRTVVGNATDGLWTAVPYPAPGTTGAQTDNQQLDVVRLDPDTGKRTTEAILPALPELTAEYGLPDGAAAVFDGSFFVLEPPFRQGDYLGYSTLARITPRASA